MKFTQLNCQARAGNTGMGACIQTEAPEVGALLIKKGDVITAKCLGVDEKGRVKMSRRAWLRDQKAAEAETQQPAGVE